MDQDNAHPPKKSVKLLNWKTVLLFWLGYAFFESSPVLITSSFSKKELSFLDTLMANTICGLLWALATPGILILARRFFITDRKWWRHLLVHSVACILISVLQITAFTFVYRAVTIQHSASLSDQLIYIVNTFFGAGLLYYWFFILAHHTLKSLDRVRHSELESAEITAQLSSARLEAIRAKIHPHFLFNTLHTVSSLVRLDRRRAAIETLAELSDLLRLALDEAQNPLVKLSDELEMVRKYLAIEQRRFADRLQLSWKIAPDTENVMVPTLLLQPLVENAIRHGVSKKTGAGNITIHARLLGDLLRLEVHDNGPGLAAHCNKRQRQGIGIKSNRARLEQLFTGRGKLWLENRSEGGVAACVTFPHFLQGVPNEQSAARGGYR